MNQSSATALHLPTEKDWQSWKWQLQNRLRHLPEFERFFQLKHEAILGLGKQQEALQSRLPFGVTPYYAKVVQGTELEKTLIPDLAELETSIGESADPLLEEEQSPAPNLIHRYPNRVLLYVTQHCASYCRYCTRARSVGKQRVGSLEKALDYIREHSEISEVILSGGDPLFLEDAKLKEILEALEAIPHVEIFRMSTKVPIALPQRITPELVGMLKQFRPLFLNLHILHPLELTRESKAAITLLQQAGVVLGSQTVLLKDVNESPEVQLALSKELLKLGVRPYSLFLCDHVQGTGHFRVSIEEGLRILNYLREKAGGLAIPQLIADPPGGKVSLHPENILSSTPDGTWLRNWKGEKVFYPR